MVFFIDCKALDCKVDAISQLLLQYDDSAVGQKTQQRRVVEVANQKSTNSNFKKREQVWYLEYLKNPIQKSRS